MGRAVPDFGDRTKAQHKTAWSVVARRSARVVLETVTVRAGGTAVFVVVIVRVGVRGVCVVVRTMVVEVRLGLVRVGLATVVECVVCVCAAEVSQSRCRALKGRSRSRCVAR